MSAATRKVLSPISEKMIMVNARTKEWKGWIMPSVPSPRTGAGCFPSVYGSVSLRVEPTVWLNVPEDPVSTGAACTNVSFFSDSNSTAFLGAVTGFS